MTEGSIAPGLGLQPGAIRIVGRYSANRRVVQGRHMPPVKDHDITHAPGCVADIARTVQPVWIGVFVGRCTNVHVYVGGMAVFD